MRSASATCTRSGIAAAVVALGWCEWITQNVVPVCRSCNASKCNDEVTAWLRRKRFGEREFLRRFVEINRTMVGEVAP